MNQSPGNPPVLEVDDVDPKSMLDWLVKQCICEWCNGTIDDYDCERKAPITPKRKWLCRITNNGKTKHWKNWLVCRRCVGLADFSRWVFPVIANLTTPESLAALVQVQPMNQPAGEVIYADYISIVRGEPENSVVLDDDSFREEMQGRQLVQHLSRFAEQALNHELFTVQHIEIDYKIADEGAEHRVV